MKEYIEREAVKAVFDGIYDCADMVFEPNDHCCSADDCGRCKWAQTKNAIKKMVMRIPAADVVEVRHGEWIVDNAPTVDAVPVVHGRWILFDKTSGTAVCDQCHRQDHFDLLAKYCRYCGAKMDGGADE